MAKGAKSKRVCVDTHKLRTRIYGFGTKLVMQLTFYCISLTMSTKCVAQTNFGPSPSDLIQSNPRPFITKTAEFRRLSSTDLAAGCNFHLTGVITLVDKARDLVVVQDATGAVAMHFQIKDQPLWPGQLVSAYGTNAVVYVPSFPQFPHWPSSNAILGSFEAPTDLGEYYLTRMRGYLHPPRTGEYTFWIASDNSSELWLSTDHDPRNKRRIAFIARYNWVDRREWSVYPSQRSAPVFLKAGERYYIEAIHEQTTLANHLAVAWAGPLLPQTIIDSQYLTPVHNEHNQVPGKATTGILWEYWTNFTAGYLEIVSGPLPFESALSVEQVRLDVLGEGQMPQPKKLVLGQRLAPEDNYLWVELVGRVTFAGLDENAAVLEISDGRGKAIVRIPNATQESIRAIQNAPIRLRGVCEGAYDQNRVVVPGLIWATAEDSIAHAEFEEPSTLSAPDGFSEATPTATSRTLSGFYSTRGVVTFNGKVFGKDYIFIQEGTAVVLVSLEGRGLKNDFKVGQWLDVAGALERDRYVPVLRPLVVREIGWHSLPTPITQSVQALAPEDSEGRWAEVDGVVQRINSNGTLRLVGKNGRLDLWISQVQSNCLSQYIDARIRARGVLSLTLQDEPMLLVPGRSFVYVEEEPPEDPFQIPTICVSNLWAIVPHAQHRVRVTGVVTYVDKHLFFLQDQTGAACVLPNNSLSIEVGEKADVVGFPSSSMWVPTLTESLVRLHGVRQPVQPQKLNISDVLSLKHRGILVEVIGNLLAQSTNGPQQVLQLQDRGYVFEAVLGHIHGRLPYITRGSRVKVVGVCEYGPVTQPPSEKLGAQTIATGLLRVLLRTPSDAIVVSKPPWWTWERTAVLVGALVITLLTALLWVHLLRRRLERHQAAQLAFARQFLQGQEAERHRIAVNLHDSLGQNLLVIKNQIRLAMQSLADESALRQRLNEISEVASQAVEEVRQIINNLHPYQLDRLGLTQAIRAIVNRASESSSIVFASHVDDVDSVFDKDSEIHIYRIVQEAVNNVLKHSQATEAAVVLKAEPGRVTISIRDNGRGFDPSKLDFANLTRVGHGLTGIAERIRILGGKWELESAPNNGTRLSIEIPRPTLGQ